MVGFAPIFGFIFLSHSVLAAPYKQQYGDSSNQPAQYGSDNKGNMYNPPSPPPSYDNKGNMYNPPSNDNKYTTSSAMMQDTTTMSMMEDTTKMMEDTTTTSMMMEDSTTMSMMMEDSTTMSMMEDTSSSSMMMDTTSTASYAAPTYGSGQNNWGKSYDDCVSKCVAQYGSPPMEWKPSESMAPPSDGGNGVIHTVMVAPMEGVLRYWPFAVNATVGDTIRYVWTTPANHTATLSSALAICNKSAKADELKWASGVRNATGGNPTTFDVLITTEETQFFYCSVKEHCHKGMFGMVQPKMGGNNTVSSYMNGWLESNPDLKAAWSNVHNQTQGTAADSWGNNMSVDGVPQEAYMDMAKNIIWSRAMFAANPGSLEANSAVTSDGSPIKVVNDLNTFLASTSQDPPASIAGTPTGPVPDTSAAASQLASSPTPKSAGFKTAVPIWVAGFVATVSYLVL
jgi:plastocyanin